ncbi:autotransporter-associated beta strand repeat-containing protein [Caulobacter sp. 17J65-9]|uniref:autotransporter-associated beta strand repeat-containing protein n=1 Tax=Caulobacter sp. 17J65-9 TaxID=2709382 RepID=UPI0013CC710A|nr:autotransporter-associated beta strand repeat-containing protein [Caulobacter sp. 17J65-9]NEX92493.1 autotransporter domain-containing protein [Caulobacter sp. 17J65-9]
MRSEQFRRNLGNGARSRTRRSALAATVSAAVLVAVFAPEARADVDTTGAWNGSNYLWSFGDSGTWTYGQTFTPGATEATLDSFTFYLSDFAGAYDLKGYVATWDGTKAGSLLFTSSATTTSGGTAFAPLSFATGGLALTPGQQYVAFLSVTETQGGASGYSKWGLLSSSAYAGGGAVYDNNTSFAELFSAPWDSSSNPNDMAFALDFTDPPTCGGMTTGDNICLITSATTITGVTDALAGTDTLELGGADDFSFDAGELGTSFVNFEQIEKTGSSTVTLTGTGGITPILVSDGTLVGTTDSIQGDVENNAALVFDNQDEDQTDGDPAGVYAGDISGSGQVTFTNGLFQLTGTNTYTGGTVIDDAVVAGDTDSIQGDVSLAESGVLVFDQTANGTYAGNISSADATPGMLVKSGTGEVTLTGTNTFAGTIQVSGGKLIGDVDAINRNVTVDVGATVVFDQGTNATYGASVNGGGALEKRGAGTLTLTGTSNYDGGTLISGGKLVGDTRSLQGAITDNAQLEFAMNSNGTFQGTGGAGTFGSISGSGSVIKSGTGTLTIGAANTYDGGTSIAGGTIKLDNLDGLGTGTVSMNGGSLRFGASGTFDNGVDFNSASGGVSAAAGQTVTIQGGIGVGDGDAMTFGSATDTGVIVLDSVGASVFSTSTVNVAGGTLRGAGSDLAFFTGNAVSTTVASGATLDFSTSTNANVFNLQGAGTVAAGANQLRLGSGSFDGVLTGTGGLLKSGSGLLRLSGTNTLTGATSITNGTLTVADGAALSDTSAVTVTSPGTLDVEDSETIGSLAGNGSVSLQSGAVLTTGGDGTSTTLSGNITGLGGLTKTGSGVFTLTGANSYSGGTTVLAGTLQGTTSSLQGDITNNAVVDFSQASGGTYAGDMSGTGSLIKSGSGAVWLTGDVDLDGGVEIQDGVLVSVDNALKSTDVTNNHGLAFSNTVAGTFAGDISGTGSLNKLGAGRLVLSGDNTYSGGTVVEAGTLAGAVGALQGDISVLTGAAVEFAQGSNATYGGDLSGGGVLVKSGAGKLTLTGTSTLSGITVEGGILQGTTANLVGDIDNDGQVIFAQASTGTYAGDMSGTGSLVKTGNGALTLSGTNSYSGGTTISGGTLKGTTDSIQGDVVNNAQLVFEQGFDGAYAGDLSGSGDVTFKGVVWYELTGTNTSTGDMTIDGSTVLADTDAIAGDIDLANGGRLNLDQEFEGTYDGDITGSGSLTKTGNGSVRLTGTSSYTGGTNVMAGNLIGDTNSLRGEIFTYFGGYVVFEQNFDATFDGEMTGFGAFVKQGAGRLTIADSQILDDLSRLEAGRLTVNGSIGALQVTNGTLNGTGTVGDLSMLGGVLAPGSSIGTLHVNGDLLLGSASLLQIEAKPGSSDLISVTGGATLQGADVSLLVQPGFYAPGTAWTIIQTGGAVSGSLGDITASQSFGLLDPKFVYGAHDVKIKLVFVPEHLYGYAQTDNQLETAHGVASLPESAAVLNALVYAPTADLPDALDQLSGEMQASLASALLDDNSFAVDATLSRLRNHDPMIPGWGVWAAARADKASLEGDPGVATLERSRDAFLTGMDYTFENGLRLGAAFGADQGDAEVADRGSKADTDGWLAEVYGRVDFGRNTFRFGGGVGGQDIATTRTVVVGPLTEVNLGETEARTANAFVELARSYGEHGALEFEPFIGAGWAKSEVDGYAETGGSSALAVGDVEVDTTYALAGLRVSREFDLGGGVLKPTGSLAWENPFGEPEAAVVNSFITAPSAPFAIRGSDLDGGRALMELGLQWESGDFKIGLTYEGAASEDFQRHGGKLYARLAF